MTKDEAKTTFRSLVARHGLQWTARDIPQIHWDMLAECNTVLDEEGRRAALGLPPTRRNQCPHVASAPNMQGTTRW